MRLPFSILFLFILSFVSNAQWSTNPGAPLRVCSGAGEQVSPRVFSDGNGGSFIFWNDGRKTNVSNNPWLYAQHFSPSGEKLFPDSGKQVLSQAAGAKYSDYAVARDNQDNFWISWTCTETSRADSIVISKFDKNTLAPLWAKPKTIARRNASNFNILYVEGIQLMPSADSLLVSYKVTWMGGSTVSFLNRLDKNGNRRLPNEGNQILGCNTCYGPYLLAPNPYGGFYFVQRTGNGSGSGVRAWRFNKKGEQVWGNLSITTGTPGLSYDFKVQPDGAGGFVMVWVRTGGDIIMTRVDSSGNFPWGTNQTVVCDYSSGQDTPDLVFQGGNWYVSWIDNRPPANNSDVYMQRINAQGQRVWNPKGRRVIRLNSYIPVPKLIGDSQGNLIVTSHHSSTGFVAQKVRPDSSLVWPGYGMLIVSGNILGPFYEQYVLAPGPDGKTFASWVGFSNKKLYIGSIDSTGILTETNDPVAGRKGTPEIYPNPVSDVLTVIHPEGILPDKIQILDLLGRNQNLTFRKEGSGSMADASSLPPGVYFLRIGTSSLRFLKK
jgi:hypothetical protein